MPKAPTPPRIALAAAVETTIDWHGYLVFGATTVPVFNPLFPAVGSGAAVP
ncbi:hypothetical protein [Catenuloplanes atrovinosus]|uniref:Uncharacterized protein n=1 Tax=Catenuloplanes atrovinosus TaxID=137266 RepID=A0AAE4C8L3_9ACTN|nr:hypothetical protein [Catenuloplanes atrovinosus]MDR7275651.1 hypothetical protein [Catenuloplanes atrovinosus]